MAIIEIKIPSPGESITHVELSHWLVEDGAIVTKDTEIAELESDKATLMLVAEESGKISFKASEGDMLEVGSVACTIDTSVQPVITAPVSPPKPTATEETKSPIAVDSADKPTVQEKANTSEYDHVKITPLAKKVMEENGWSVEDVIHGLRRLRREDVEASMLTGDANESSGFKKPVSRSSNSERMSALRRKLSERLVSVKNETAMLTTFNEVDMKPIMDLRKRHQSAFVEKTRNKAGHNVLLHESLFRCIEGVPLCECHAGRREPGDV